MSNPNEEDTVEDLSNPDVVTKYRQAGDITNAALAAVIEKCVPGALIVELCETGDKFMDDAVSKIYNKVKGISKGIGFPTCVSINHIVGHNSPMSDDKSTITLGDTIKIDLGAQIDGYATVTAHTFVLGEAGPVEATGKAADVMAAAQTAAELALRMLKVGNKNTPITEMFAKVAADYGVNVLQGVLSHNMTRHVIDGEKVVISKADVEHKVEEVEFAPNEVYAIDIVMSTGEGKPLQFTDRPTVYKRQLDETYQLKIKASRQVFNEITKRYPTFPFALRSFGDAKVRFGIKECQQHNLVTQYPVLCEKEGDHVAHVKFTAALMPNGTLKLAGVPHAAQNSEKKLTDPELAALLATSVGNKKKKKKNKKKPAAKAEE